MSEPRLLTPLLTGYIMGDPICDHHGIRCCPALNTETEEKYIVKILSIPASRRQLDALLLSGAYASAEEAREYFRGLANDAVEEAKTLQKLAKLEGFWGCEDWQLEPTEDGSGFEVYLLTRYGTTLEYTMRKKSLTHLAAVNLGLDLCAALSVSRRNGWLYANLKPENIMFSDTRGYLIGDLGFLSLRSLKYASLPDKYRSAYTAPEILDAYSTLNATLDIYALGRILLQVFNGGVLPEDPEAPAAYADPEMSLIIRKACAEDPAERWQDPEEMAQALVAYMQSHTVNDTSIVPLPEPEPAAEEAEEEVPTPVEEIIDEAPVEVVVETEPEFGDVLEEEVPASVDSDPEVEDAPDEELSVPDEVPAAVLEEEPAAAGEEPEQFVIEGFLFDEEQDDDALAQLSNAVISDEVSEMLAQADELIAHPAPEPVVAPEAIDVPIPAPILPEPEPEVPDGATSEASAPAEEESQPEAADEPAADEAEEELPVSRPHSRRKLGWLAAILSVILVLVLAGIGGKYYYENIYLQHIGNITCDGAEDWLIVSLDTEIDNSLLSVSCTDAYGNRITRPVHNNKATFTELPSATHFKIAVTISGRHQLTGVTTSNYSSDAKTVIQDFKAIAGATDGSVILNFSVQGPDSASGWVVKYSAPGTPELTAPCNSHSAMITGLEVGKTYTFRLVPQEDLYLAGGETTEFTALAVIQAQNLAFLGFENNALIAQWEVPEGAQVSNWIVRCFNSDGYDSTVTVTEPRIVLEGLDISGSYTLDVKAEGMLEGKQITVSANSVTFKEMLIDDSDPNRLVIHWPYEGTAPTGGWTLRYTIDGSNATDVVCNTNSWTLENLIPGSRYVFEVVVPEGVDFFGLASKEFQVPDAGTFSGYQVTAEMMQYGLCIRPDQEGWTYRDVSAQAYTNGFTVGQSAGLVIYLTEEYSTSPDMITVTYILRDADGVFLRMEQTQSSWTDLWYGGYCELDLPQLPEDPGVYVLSILFNDAYITRNPISFSVAEGPAPEPAA